MSFVSKEEYDKLPFIEFDYYNDEKQKCPYCNIENVHPVEININAGGTIINIKKIDMQGINITKGNPIGRGVHIDLGFSCESGHKWIERYVFYKGCTYKQVKVLNCKLNEEKEPDFDTIWRD